MPDYFCIRCRRHFAPEYEGGCPCTHRELQAFRTRISGHPGGYPTWMLLVQL